MKPGVRFTARRLRGITEYVDGYDNNQEYKEPKYDIGVIRIELKVKIY